MVHGLSIPALSLIYKYYSVSTITDDAVELRRTSIYVPTPANAFKGDKDTFIAYNRFFRPLSNTSMLPLAHAQSDDQISALTELGGGRKNEPHAL